MNKYPLSKFVVIVLLTFIAGVLVIEQANFLNAKGHTAEINNQNHPTPPDPPKRDGEKEVNPQLDPDRGGNGGGGGGPSCSLSASPTSGDPGLTVRFSLSYGGGGCREPEPSWNAPCSPYSGCNYTFNNAGNYGPYSAGVQYYDIEYRGPESVEHCVPSSSASCSSPQIRVNARRPTVDLKANGSDGPITISYNTSATLSWTSTDANTCNASNGWTGSKAPTGGSESTGNLTSSRTYDLTCNGPGGNGSDNVTVNVGPAPPPPPPPPPPPSPSPSPSPSPQPWPVVSLTTNPSTIPFGGASTLSWSSQNAISCLGYCELGQCQEWDDVFEIGDAIGTPKSLSGTTSVSPNTTSRYGLRCFNSEANSDYKNVTVSVAKVKWREIIPIFQTSLEEMLAAIGKAVLK